MSTGDVQALIDRLAGYVAAQREVRASLARGRVDIPAPRAWIPDDRTTGRQAFCKTRVSPSRQDMLNNPTSMLTNQYNSLNSTFLAYGRRGYGRGGYDGLRDFADDQPSRAGTATVLLAVIDPSEGVQLQPLNLSQASPYHYVLVEQLPEVGLGAGKIIRKDDAYPSAQNLNSTVTEAEHALGNNNSRFISASGSTDWRTKLQKQPGVSNRR